METRLLVYDAIRRKLCGNSNITALVATRNIRVSLQPVIASYPAIRIRVVGGNGNNFSNYVRGDAYIGIYTAKQDQPSSELARIYGYVYDTLHDRTSTLSTTNIGIAMMKEDHVEYPMWNEEINKYFLMARYSYVAHNRS